MSDLGAILHALEHDIREARAMRATLWRVEAERSVAAFGLLPASERKEWREGMALSAAAFSRMRTVVNNLPEDCARELSTESQYELAKAVRDGYDLDTILPLAESLSVSAFREEVLGIERKVRGPEEFECPVCHTDGTKDDFRRKEEAPPCCDGTS